MLVVKVISPSLSLSLSNDAQSGKHRDQASRKQPSEIEGDEAAENPGINSFANEPFPSLFEIRYRIFRRGISIHLRVDAPRVPPHTHTQTPTTRISFYLLFPAFCSAVPRVESVRQSSFLRRRPSANGRESKLRRCLNLPGYYLRPKVLSEVAFRSTR